MSNEIPSDRYHPAITVTVGPWCEEIDIVLAPLIREIWIAGIETFMSCQETEPGISWIEFPGVAELLEFLNLVTRYEEGADTLYNRINYQLTGQLSAPTWFYQLNLLDIFEGQVEQTVDGNSCLEATVGVYFPSTDIPVLLERLKKFNAAE